MFESRVLWADCGKLLFSHSTFTYQVSNQAGRQASIQAIYQSTLDPFLGFKGSLVGYSKILVHMTPDLYLFRLSDCTK